MDCGVGGVAEKSSRRRLRVPIAEVPAALPGVLNSKSSGVNGRAF